VQVSEEEKLYGSVTSLDIVRALREQGHDIERRQIMLEAPIRLLGDYSAHVRLHRDVSVPVAVSVVRE
jgi:large subunit ribosomal protein L9